MTNSATEKQKAVREIKSLRTSERTKKNKSTQGMTSAAPAYLLKLNDTPRYAGAALVIPYAY